LAHHITLPDWAVQRGRFIRQTTGGHQPSKTAVFVIDMQNYFIAEGQPLANSHAQDIIPNINKVTEALRNAGGTSVFVQHRQLNNQKVAFSGTLIDKMVEDLEPHKYGYQLHKDLEIKESDVKISKRQPSIFNPAAQADIDFLNDRGIDTLIITGTLTNGCCECTTRDAFQAGYRVIFVSDATAAATDDEHNATLLNVAIYFAEVLKTSEVIGLFNRS
jgi:ureidoacrylate peracid hydrolase